MDTSVKTWSYDIMCDAMQDRGWVDGWLEGEEDDNTVGDPMGFDFRSMSFKAVTDKVQEKQYTDFTLKDLQSFESKVIYIDKSLEANPK